MSLASKSNSKIKDTQRSLNVVQRITFSDLKTFQVSTWNVWPLNKQLKMAIYINPQSKRWKTQIMTIFKKMITAGIQGTAFLTFKPQRRLGIC